MPSIRLNLEEIESLSVSIQETRKRILQDLSRLSSQVDSVIGNSWGINEGDSFKGDFYKWIRDVKGAVEHGEELSKNLQQVVTRFQSADIVAGGRFVENTQDSQSLRAWWHKIIRNYGKLSCYAIFLVLPSDKEAKKYLNDYSKELNLITGRESLVLMFGEEEFKSSNIGEDNWDLIVEKHVSEGYSTKIARLFEVEYSGFPCVLFFQDIRSPEYVVVTLKGMTAEEIAEKMRVTFSIIEKAIQSKKNPIEILSNKRREEKLQKTGNAIVGEIRNFTGKTLETAMEAIINSAIKP